MVHEARHTKLRARHDVLAEGANRYRGFGTLEKISVDHTAELSRKAHKVERLLKFSVSQLGRYAPRAVTSLDSKFLSPRILSVW